MNWNTILFALTLCTLTGCSSFYERPPPSSGLPSLLQLSCCWQEEEKVVITLEDKAITLHAVVAREPDKLTIVMLDNFGHRQLTLLHTQAGTQVLTTPHNWDDRFNTLLLMGIFLHQNRSRNWLGEHSPWQAELDSAIHRKSLSYKGEEWMSIHYDATSADSLSKTRTIEFNQLPLMLNVTTLSRTAL